MITQLAYRFLTEVHPRILWKFIYNFGWKGMRAVSHFRKRLQASQYFPAFLMISLTDQCNLCCQGCWVTPQNPPRILNMEILDKIVRAANQHHSYFFGILGGEPFLYPNLLEWLARHPTCYFQLFTNGTLITKEMALALRKLGNVTPLISIEGIGKTSDMRRGGNQVYERALNGIRQCCENGLITGVATSVCQSNFDELVKREFLEDMISQGVQYVWYYIYRPVGPKPTPELSLSPGQILSLRRFLVEIRTQLPIIVVDAYWDHLGNSLCPGAIGLSHHIGPGGDVEFCPPLQFAKEKILLESDIHELFANSKFLQNLRKLCQDNTPGCILLESPELLMDFLQQHNPQDSSGRGQGFIELSSMKKLPSHHISGAVIPEKHWLYRWAKRYGFFGLGGYG